MGLNYFNDPQGEYVTSTLEQGRMYSVKSSFGTASLTVESVHYERAGAISFESIEVAISDSSGTKTSMLRNGPMAAGPETGVNDVITIQEPIRVSACEIAWTYRSPGVVCAYVPKDAWISET